MRILLLLSILLLVGCATPNHREHTAKAIEQEMDLAVQSMPTGNSNAVNDALLPPLSLNLPTINTTPAESRFDLAVNNTPATQVFMAIVSGTRYSVLLHPDVSGTVSINLKDVTVFEALESIRELYGYDYKVDGTRIYIQSIALQTRIFQVNYLTGLRSGVSNLRVTGGSVADSVSTNGGISANSSATTGMTGTTGTSNTASTIRGPQESSKVTTTSSADFWTELSASLKAIVGQAEGRSVVISPMSGVIVVRAMPDELRNVAAYLKASQISIERQVILEAKIIEVQLNDSYQTGVNWGGFGSLQNRPTNRAAFGVLSPGSTLVPNAAGAAQTLTNGVMSAQAGTGIAVNAANAVTGATIPGAMFGLAFQTNNFAALLNFLETQGDVHVLSSPRIATLNNQKAVLKVGTDEFFVTEISGGTSGTLNVAGTAPSVKVQPFFSGIALDVTPRIDENNEIILHVHPSVSVVSTINKSVNLGTGTGVYNLPLASSSISETDSIVRARDGQIVAIGGLMRQANTDDRSGLPGLSKNLFGQTSQVSQKRELIILLKPTVVDSDQDWADDIARSRDRLNRLSSERGK
ncbi:MAG: secretin N-terminal domain-containing protein [Gallionella sp.]|nr:secretin N-terminal domain-containing protein [Gallionella sp.]